MLPDAGFPASFLESSWLAPAEELPEASPCPRTWGQGGVPLARAALSADPRGPSTAHPLPPTSQDRPVAVGSDTLPTSALHPALSTEMRCLRPPGHILGTPCVHKSTWAPTAQPREWLPVAIHRKLVELPGCSVCLNRG